MTINLKNFLSDKTKLSKMGEFQNLKQIEGLEMSSVSADLYGNGRDDLSLFYFSRGANYATVTTTNSIISETIAWNNSSHKKSIKGLMVNTKNANTFTGKQGKESLDITKIEDLQNFVSKHKPEAIINCAAFVGGIAYGYKYPSKILDLNSKMALNLYSVLNKNNQLHSVPNVYVTDGSAMTSSGSQNPSLTYMALTARAANHAVKELKKMNL